MWHHWALAWVNCILTQPPPKNTGNCLTLILLDGPFGRLAGVPFGVLRLLKRLSNTFGTQQRIVSADVVYSYVVARFSASLVILGGSSQCRNMGHVVGQWHRRCRIPLGIKIYSILVASSRYCLRIALKLTEARRTLLNRIAINLPNAHKMTNQKNINIIRDILYICQSKSKHCGRYH